MQEYKNLTKTDQELYELMEAIESSPQSVADILKNKGEKDVQVLLTATAVIEEGKTEEIHTSLTLSIKLPNRIGVIRDLLSAAKNAKVLNDVLTAKITIEEDGKKETYTPLKYAEHVRNEQAVKAINMKSTLFPDPASAAESFFVSKAPVVDCSKNTNNKTQQKQRAMKIGLGFVEILAMAVGITAGVLVNPLFHIITVIGAVTLLGALLYHRFEKAPDAKVDKIGEAKGVTPFMLPDPLNLVTPPANL